jgi:hypothetical protein
MLWLLGSNFESTYFNSDKWVIFDLSGIINVLIMNLLCNLFKCNSLCLFMPLFFVFI